MIHKSSAMIAMALLAVACAPSASKSEADIKALVKAQFEKSDAPVTVDPIAVEGAFAVADWTQGSAGGRALLQKGAKGWLLVLCGGDSLRTVQGLMRQGVPDNQAVAIARELAREEKNVSADRLAAMARFSGEVRM